MADAERQQAISWKEYLSWPPDERFELIDGEPYAMSPAPFDVKLSPREADERPTVVQPDLTVVCDEAKLTDQGVTGPPELVAEIVSPDTDFHDRGRKFELYERYGVAEYWIVDANEKLIEVYRLENSRFLRAGVSGPEDTLKSAAVPPIEVHLSALFPPGSAGEK